jgi:hypothetical protein
MKKIILLIVIMTVSLSYAQNNQNSSSNNEKFEYTDKGLEPKFLLVSVNKMKKEQLQAKAKKWIKEKFGKPEDHIQSSNLTEEEEEKGKKKSKKLRFKGFADNAICFGLNTNTNYKCKKVNYTILLKLYDGEYQFKPVKLDYRSSHNNRKIQIHLNKSDFHTSNGEVKTEYDKVSKQLENLLNKLNNSLFNYLTDKPQSDEW